MIRTGLVCEIDPALVKVRVKFPELDHSTGWLPVLKTGTLKEQAYGMPHIDEHVAVLLDEHGEAGLVLGAIYSGADVAPAVMLEDAPESYGFIDEMGTWFKVNKRKGFAELQHMSGSRIRMEADGQVSIRSKKAIVFESADGHTTFGFDMASGKMSFSPRDAHEISSPKVSTVAAEVVECLGSKTESIDGGKQVTVLGGSSESVGGSKSLSVGGNRAEVIVQDNNTLIGKKDNETVGLGKETTVVAGGYKIEVKLGNMTISTLAGSAEMKTAVGSMKVGATGDIDLKSAVASIKISAQGVTINGMPGAVMGVVTQQCICSFTGAPHPMGSLTTKASL